jgi:ABC-type cobalamin/Fe3+-siderophores transport system ATPase subunit
MIGASGVGKTTLFKKLNRIPKNSRNFITLTEAYKSTALVTDISIAQLDLYCYKKILKFGLFKRKELGLSKVILSRQNHNPADERYKYNDFNISFDILYHALIINRILFLSEKESQNF